MGLCGGGGGTTTQTIQQADPWAGQQPFLTNVFNQARQQYYGDQPQYYPGSTVVPFANETSNALNLQTNRAVNGSPITAAGQNQLTDTLSGNYLTANPAFDLFQQTAQGDYLNSNPYIDQVVQNALNKVRSNVDSQFESSGRYGSGLHKTALAQTEGDIAAQMYGDNYARERQNMLAAAAGLGGLYGDERTKQMQAMLFAPQMANQDYYDIAKLAEVGGAREGQSQATLDDLINRWNFNQNLPANKLQQYANLVNGTGYGGTSSTESMSPTSSNPLMGALGGGLAGAGIASMGGLFGSAATATAPAVAASPWAWPLVGGAALLGGLLS